jgi:putative ABC transport system permease protein
LPRSGWAEGRRHVQPFHGLAFDPKAEHEEVYTITGVLAPTNTPADR